MLHAFSRTELLMGAAGLKRLQQSKVAVFGIGGVGSFAVEALVRSGVGHLVLIDDDRICLTNLNRQLHATRKTVGRFKVEAMRDRILEINPKAQVTLHQAFYNPGSADALLAPDLDYILDCIDTVTGKVDLVVQAQRLGIPIISCMGTGNKLDPTRLEVTDLAKTLNCPLARTMRKELGRLGVRHLRVVYSQEEILVPQGSEDSDCTLNCICPAGAARTCTSRRQIPGSVSFVPSVAGLIMAGEVIKALVKKHLEARRPPPPRQWIRGQEHFVSLAEDSGDGEGRGGLG